MARSYYRMTDTTNLLVLNAFNNYKNRVYKKFPKIAGYISAARSYSLVKTVNFNPGDGVTTEVVVGKGDLTSGDYDYLVVYLNDGDEETDIQSRWFVMDEERLRGGQYRLTLRRDLLADMLNSTIAANMPVDINKAIITDNGGSNPLLFNHEDITVNQIKSEREILLKDPTQCPWLVLYLEKGVLGSDHSITISTGSYTPDYTLTTAITDWAYYQYREGGLGTDFKASDRVSYWMNYHPNNNLRINAYKYQTKGNGTKIESTMPAEARGGAAAVYSNLNLTAAQVADIDNVRNALDSAMNYYKSDFVSYVNTACGLGEFGDILAYDNKIIKDSNNKYWQIKVVYKGADSEALDVTTGSVYTLMTTVWNYATVQSATPNNQAFKLLAEYSKYRLEITELVDASCTINLQNLNIHCDDSPLFDAICMPYGSITYTNASEYLHSYTTSASKSLEIMNAIATQLTSSLAMDLQILPYCPIRIPEGASGDYSGIGGYMIEGSSTPTMFVGNAPQLGIIVYGNSNQDIIYGVRKANSSFNIMTELYSDIYKYANSITDYSQRVKYVNDCTMMRLCSPNYAGVFEFNLAKNGMNVEYFNVDMTLRPYNPYIHVNPSFNQLYGADTDDQRGLLCGGDFSLGTINSAWAQYEIQNKNYQAIFDRQIQNLDVMRDIQRVQNIAGAVGGAFQGGAAGAATGFFTGGIPGAIGGAIGGGLLSAGAGAADVVLGEKAYEEQRSFMQDNFKLQLGNVKALPYSITKTSALTLNNKLFPFIELYECTEAEKNAYVNKIRYDGMSIGVIGTMSTYVDIDNPSDKYFQGRIVRYTGESMTNHELTELNNELMKGVYF